MSCLFALYHSIAGFINGKVSLSVLQKTTCLYSFFIMVAV